MFPDRIAREKDRDTNEKLEILMNIEMLIKKIEMPEKKIEIPMKKLEILFDVM